MKKLLSTTLCIVIVLLSLSACQKQPTIYADKDNSPAIINIWEGDDFMKHHINTYNSLFDEPQIEYNALSFEDLDSFFETLESDINEGKGPDLILIDIMFRTFGQFENKLACFADMDQMIDRSPTFNFDNYNQDIMDYKIEEDKRWYIPFSYDVSCVVSIREALELYYSEISDVIDYDKYLMAIEQYQMDKQNSPATFGIHITAPLFIKDIEDFKNIIPTEKLEKALYIVKKDHGRFKYINFDERNNNFTKWFIDNEILFTRIHEKINLSTPPEIKAHNSLFAEIYYTYNVAKGLDKELLVFKYPSIDPEKSSIASASMGLAISATSDRKNKAMRFIEYMLSVDVQAAKSYPPRIPVNNEAFDILVDEFTSGSYDLFPDGVDEMPLPDDIAMKVLNIIKDAKVPSDDIDINNAFYECVEPHIQEYQDNFLTFEKFINLVNSNLDRYYSQKEEDESDS